MNIGQRPTQLTIPVTQKNIDRGIARHSNKCPIGDAIKDAYPQFSHISVDIATIRVSDKKRGLRSMYFTPPVIQKFIIGIDQGNRASLKPFVTRCVAGQVVPIAKRTPKEKERLRKKYLRLKTRQIKRQKVARERLKMLKTGGGSGKVPVVSGGKLPPIAQGKSRTFGLRTLMV